MIPRALAPELAHAARAFPAVILTGPRRSGKTTLLRALFPRAEYHLLEDPDLVARFRADPRTFMRDSARRSSSTRSSTSPSSSPTSGPWWTGNRGTRGASS